jgi:hypothetical protein
MADQSGWVENASGAAAVATATKTADAGKQHIVDSVDASAAGAAEILLLQIKDDTTVIWEGHVHQSREVSFPKGLSITKGNACSAVLAAGAGVTKVNLHGRTR